MPVRPGRLLPSVIVGALVTGALAWGAGTASAADPITIDDLLSGQCIDPDTRQATLIVEGLTRDATTGVCEPVRTATPEPEVVIDPPDVEIDPSPDVDPAPDPIIDLDPESSGTTDDSDDTNNVPPAGPGSGGNGGPQPGPVFIQPPSALPAPDVRGGVLPNANLLTPGGAYGGLAATTPALGFGTLDPSLLLAPAGSPLRTLTGVDEGSPVTTVSDVQAMAFDNLPGGLGMPAIAGTLILSAFAAFALRHRVLHRARMAADADADTGPEADTAEIPAREPVG
jgi:hypothetical protein